MGRLFSFNSLITPSIIKFVFYLLVVVQALGSLGVVMSASSYFRMFGYGGVGFLLGLVAGVISFVVGVVVLRVGCEITLVVFMVRDELAWQREQKIAEKQA